MTRGAGSAPGTASRRPQQALAPDRVNAIADQVELEALIEEARQRARRRRIGFAALALGALAAAAGLYFWFGGGSGGGNVPLSASPGPPAAPVDVSRSQALANLQPCPGGDWSTETAAISCANAQRLILDFTPERSRGFLADFDSVGSNPAAIAAQGPGTFRSSGFKCRHVPRGDGWGWQLTCRRGRQAIRFQATP